MRFIRKNGRVIPIREDNATPMNAGQAAAQRPLAGSGSDLKAFALAGAAQAMTFKAAPKLSLGIGLARGTASLINGIQYGRQTHSITSGVGRTLVNDVTGIAGFGAGLFAAHKAVSALRSPGVRKAAKTAGGTFRGAKGSTTVMKKPFAGPMKDVLKNVRRLKGK